MRTNVTIFAAVTFVCLGVVGQANAGYKKLNTVSFKKPIYLGEAESTAVKSNLIANKFSDESFNLVFRCHKYKRAPSSKSKAVNCVAVAVLPDVDQAPRHKNGSKQKR